MKNETKKEYALRIDYRNGRWLSDSIHDRSLMLQFRHEAGLSARPWPDNKTTDLDEIVLAAAIHDHWIAIA